jgi:catechol 2,3-dioxygenase-like lactoylglutathione lyase family enzyme
VSRLEHGVALEVSNLERAARFYLDVFEGRRLTRPISIDAETAALPIGLRGTVTRYCDIEFDHGDVQLFESAGHVPPLRSNRVEARIPRLVFRVDDFPATLEYVETAGGRRLWRADPMPSAYVADPDGYLIEVMDAALKSSVESGIRPSPINATVAHSDDSER